MNVFECFSGSFGTVYHAEWRNSVSLFFFLYILSRVILLYMFVLIS